MKIVIVSVNYNIFMIIILIVIVGLMIFFSYIKKRLHEDMRNSVQSRLSADYSGGGDGEDGDALVLQNLQQQLELAVQV